MREVSTRYYVENQGIHNNAGESLEREYVQLQIDGDTIHTYTLAEFHAIEDELVIWNHLAALGFDIDTLSENIAHDPFIP